MGRNMVKKTIKTDPIKKRQQAVAMPMKEYAKVFLSIKSMVQEAQIRAAVAANQELTLLYWKIGEVIDQQQSWGSKFIEELAGDMQNEFPGIEGFSRSNLFRMRAFYLEYRNCLPPVRQFDDDSDLSILSRIPWGHNITLMEQISSLKERLWYAQKSIQNGWSRNILAMQIDSDLYSRQGKAITNFTKTLPAPHSDLAQQTLKDPYVFDFLTLSQDYVERDVEQGLIDNVQKLLMELGQGFALVGRQYHVKVDDDDYFIDLLFYHVQLHCFMVVELKAGKLTARDIGQLNFYIAAIDNQVKSSSDNATIGLLLCRTKGKRSAEYALQGINTPIGVASYEAHIVEKLPKALKSRLPSVKEIEAELEKKEFMGALAARRPMRKAKAKKSTKKTTKKRAKTTR